jgi:hypothetical protein
MTSAPVVLNAEVKPVHCPQAELGVQSLQECQDLMLALLGSECAYALDVKSFLQESLRPYARYVTVIHDGTPSITILEAHGMHTIVFAYRGTAGFDIVWTNLQALLIPSFGKGRVHAGFASRVVDSDIGNMTRYVSQGFRVVITGHSVGGAVAVLAAAKLLRTLPAEHRHLVSCVTFAQPLVGDRDMAEDMNAYQDHFHAMVLAQDCIPRVFLMKEDVIKMLLTGLQQTLGQDFTKASLKTLLDKLNILLADLLGTWGKVADVAVAGLGIAVDLGAIWATNAVADQVASEFVPFGKYFLVEEDTVNVVTGAMTERLLKALGGVESLGAQEIIACAQNHKLSAYATFVEQARYKSLPEQSKLQVDGQVNVAQYPGFEGQCENEEKNNEQVREKTTNKNYNEMERELSRIHGYQGQVPWSLIQYHGHVNREHGVPDLKINDQIYRFNADQEHEPHQEHEQRLSGFGSVVWSTIHTLYVLARGAAGVVFFVLQGAAGVIFFVLFLIAIFVVLLVIFGLAMFARARSLPSRR